MALAVTMLTGAQNLWAQDVITPERQALMGQQTVTEQQTKIQAEAEKQAAEAEKKALEAQKKAEKQAAEAEKKALDESQSKIQSAKG